MSGSHVDDIMDRAGVVGVGLMGSALTRRLVGSRFDVRAYDVDEAKLDTIERIGARQVESIATLVDDCETIVIAVYSTDQVEQVVEEIADRAAAIATERIVICTSTCDPDRLAALAKRVFDERVLVLELPLSGTSRQVDAGDGVGLVGGPPALVERCAPILNAICIRRFHLGEVGSASRAKLAVNLILGLNRAAIAEGLVFADRLGLDRDSFLEVAKGSAAYSAVMETKGAAMAKRRYTNPQSRVDQSLKDFSLILEQAATRGQTLPFARTYANMLEDCVSHGEAEWDNAAIIEAVARQRKDSTPTA